MGPKEILRRYREAKDKREIIEVLAGLNDCSRDDIIECLTWMGEYIPRPNEKFDMKTILFWISKDMSCSAIGRELGVSHNTVSNWRKRYSLT